LNKDAMSTSIWIDIQESLQQLLSEQGRELGEIGPQTTLTADLGLDSTDKIHLLITLEDKLEVPLHFDELATDENDEIREDLTLGELNEFLESKVAAHAGAGRAGDACA
jgi:acyl carrier protein